MVVFDSTILLPVLWPNIPPPTDPNTDSPVSQFHSRVDFLIEDLERKSAKIIVPTPTLSEVLIRSESAGSELIGILSSKSVFQIVAFDERAAVEVAVMTTKALESGDKRGGVDSTWAKIKFDRQIVAIAKVAGATTLYSDDLDIRLSGENAGLTVISAWELPLPPVDPQSSLHLGFAEENYPQESTDE